LTGYARSLPYLGFDPAPGDVGLTQSLAHRHYQVAAEARQVLAVLERLDLSAWQGRAGDAMRALQATFPPALRNTASAAQTLQAATSSWAAQLSGFQAEADALERQAASASAQHQALQTQQAALPPDSRVLNGELESSSAAVSRIQGQAQELHERYLAAAAKTAADADRTSGLWGKTEPVRTVLEAVLAPFDIVAADHWVGALKEVAGVPAEWVKEVDEAIDEVNEQIRAGRSPVAALIEAGDLAESTGGKIDAWYAFAPGWLKTAAGSLAEIRGLS
jgi:transposase